MDEFIDGIYTLYSFVPEEDLEVKEFVSDEEYYEYKEDQEEWSK